MKVSSLVSVIVDVEEAILTAPLKSPSSKRDDTTARARHAAG